MALGGLHKDSILNLAALASEDEDSGDYNPNEEQIEEHEEIVDISHDAAYANFSLNQPAGNFSQHSSSSTLNGPTIRDSLELKKAIELRQPNTVTPAGYYSGFNQNFEDQYDYDPYAPSNFRDEANETGGGIFACLFPFCSPEKKKKDEKHSSQQTKITAPSSTLAPTVGGETQSGNLSEKGATTTLLSNIESKQNDGKKDLQGTLEQVSKPNSPSDIEEEKKDSSGKILPGGKDDSDIDLAAIEESIKKIAEKKNAPSDTSDQPSNLTQSKNGIKGILKKPPKPFDLTKEDAAGANRRSLFQGSFYEPSFEQHIKEDRPERNLRFAPMAKVVIVPGRHHMAEFIKREIWWSRVDYEDFKKAGRIISRALLEGGSEIWLSSKSGFTLSAVNQNDHQDGKWWCKFGHSRRGLEHIASIEEGRHRQQNVSNSIKSVITEQRRQRIYNIKDDERLSKVPFKFTSFARDLALAAGAADAEAVKTNFRAKQRPHFKSLPQGKAFNEENVRALDVHTQSAARVRRYERRMSFEQEKKNLAPTAPKIETKDETEDHSHDIAKIAAGFGNSETDPVGFTERRASFSKKEKKGIDLLNTPLIPLGTVSN